MRSRLSAPKQVTWFIALILGVVGILATVAELPGITPAIAFWLVVVGWALLLLASITRDL